MSMNIHTLKIFLYGLFTIGLMFGCTTNMPVKRENFIAQHPEWNQPTKELIRSGIVTKGMTRDQVEAAWGQPPCWYCETMQKGDWGEAWEYTTDVVFFNAEGRVTRISSR